MTGHQQGGQLVWLERDRRIHGRKALVEAPREESDMNPEALKDTIMELLDRRRPGASMCPSEVARTVQREAWRKLMGQVRAAARDLAADGELEICQRGRIVDPDRAKGPIRLRLPSEKPDPRPE